MISDIIKTKKKKVKTKIIKISILQCHMYKSSHLNRLITT